MTPEGRMAVVMFIGVACAALFGAELVRQDRRVAMDTVYVPRPPAGPTVLRDSFTAVLGELRACDARLCQHLDDCAWRTPARAAR